MSDTILTYDDLINYTVDPFDGSTNYVVIGTDRPSERRTIPASPPYRIRLFHAPVEDSPSLTYIETVSGGTPLVEVSATTVPAAGQYRVNYEEPNIGWIDFNAAQAGVQVDISYSAKYTIINTQTFAFRLSALGASLVFASSNSSASDKLVADYIIDTTDDAGLTINTYASGMTGDIKLMNGTYNVKTIITLDNGVNLIGSGIDTVLTKAANIANIINISGKTNVALRNFSANGVKATYTGANYHNIVGNNDYNMSIYNVYSYNADDSGFSQCINVTDCNSYSNGSHGFNVGGYIKGSHSYSNGGDGFNGSLRVTNSRAYNNIIGFNDVDELSVCYSYSNSSHGVYLCNQLSSIQSYNNGGHGVYLCRRLSSVFSFSSTLHGFYQCESLSSCYAQQNIQDGFNDCGQLSACISYNDTTNGFNTCIDLSSCRSESNVIGFNNSSNISACYAYLNSTIGFYKCNNISSSKAESNSNNGFQNCLQLSGCTAISNTNSGFIGCRKITSCLSSTNTTYGFYICNTMGFNQATGNVTANYNTSYADSAAVAPAADTATGGYNY